MALRSLHVSHAVGVCRIVELIMLVCAMTPGNPLGVQDGIGVLLQAKYSEVQRLSTLLVVPLNIIGPVLIAIPTMHAIFVCS